MTNINKLFTNPIKKNVCNENGMMNFKEKEEYEKPHVNKLDKNSYPSEKEGAW